VALGISSAISAGRDVPDKQLFLDLTLFQTWLKDAYASNYHQQAETDVGECLASMGAQLCRIVGDRLQVRVMQESLLVKIPRELLNAALSCSIQNALVHSSGKVYVRLEYDQVYITNEASSQCEMPFYVFRSEIEGEMPPRSAGSAATGTGLISLLKELRHTRAIDYDLRQDGKLIAACLTFDYESIIRERSSARPSAPLEIPLAKPNIVFLCHDNYPKTTYSQLLEVPVVGPKYCPMLAIEQFDWIGSEEKQKEMRKLLRANEQLFENSSLCLVHMTVGGFRTVLRDLSKMYPHLVLCPVSSEPDHWYDRKLEKFHETAQDKITPQVLSMGTIREYLRPDDPASAAEIAAEIHRSRLTRPVWEAIIAVAGRRSEALARTGRKGSP
jgi:hypothetical protein